MEANPAVIYDKKDRMYKKFETERLQCLEAFCKTDPCQQTNDDDVLKKAVSNSSDEGGAGEVEEEEDQDVFIQKERAKRIRKLTRGLHEFTGVLLEGERKCNKGWSDEAGMVAFENM